MPKKKDEIQKPQRDISLYKHTGKTRLNNPPVGLVNADNDQDFGKKQYQYDPHIDPSLQWAGKSEHTSFEVPTVSLHVHEHINPWTVINAVRTQKVPEVKQVSLFDTPEEHLSFREAVEFYKHSQGWSNRLIAGDSLLVMNSLLEKEGMAGQVQMIYIDPPYGIRYGSNFQPFVNKRSVKENDEDLTQEPEMIKAFRDTWEKGIHSYLTYLRDRLLLARELLTESGSVFVQISDENVHYVRNILEEVMGRDNFICQISYQTAPYATSNTLPVVHDYIIWYAKSAKNLKFNTLFRNKEDIGSLGLYRYILSPDSNEYRSLSQSEIETNLIPKGWKRYRLVSLISQGSSGSPQPFEFDGTTYNPPANSHWKVTVEGLHTVAAANRLQKTQNSIQFRSFIDDFPISIMNNLWTDTITGSFNEPKRFVVQTNTKVIQRCMLMCSDPGDIVLDPTCGSGTTAYVAEQWGRRWITCDTSRVAVTLAKQRLMTAVFDYYNLAQPQEGVGSGFSYKTLPHVTLGTIANNEPPTQETLYDQPYIDKTKVRVTGPFTVEAVPAPVVQPLEAVETEPASDNSVAHSGETRKQAEWRDELLRTGIRLRQGQKLEFSRIGPLSGTTWIQADAETKEDSPRRAVVCFGNEFKPLDARMVDLALEEAGHLFPKPKLIIFAAFQFDPEAAKDIDETIYSGMTLLKIQMNTDLLTEDLKKNRSNNESFWLIGQPDVLVTRIEKGADKGKYKVKVNGFDYYNTKTGRIESGGSDRITMWMLDTDYDGRSLYPRQVFFPMAGDNEGWRKLAKNLKAEIDVDLVEAYWGVESLPFEVAKMDTRIALKIIDDRGIESLRIIKISEVR